MSVIRVPKEVSLAPKEVVLGFPSPSWTLERRFRFSMVSWMDRAGLPHEALWDSNGRFEGVGLCSLRLSEQVLEAPQPPKLGPKVP